MMWYLVERYVTLLERDRKERDVVNGTGGSTTPKVESDETKKVAKRSAKRKASKNGEENKENVEQSEEAATGAKASRAPVEVKVENEVAVEVGNEEEEEEEGEERTNGVGDAENTPKKPWTLVHLSSREVDGLLMVVERMRKWPTTNVPEVVQDPAKLLDRLEVICCMFFACISSAKINALAAPYTAKYIFIQ